MGAWSVFDDCDTLARAPPRSRRRQSATRMEPRVYAPRTSSPSSSPPLAASRPAAAVAGAPTTPTTASATMATNEHRWFAVDDFLRVDDVARGEREWRDVRPCVLRSVECVAYELRRHDKAI